MANKKNKQYEGKIPFRVIPEFSYSDGTKRESYREQLSYDDRDRWVSNPAEWKDNCSFYANLEFKSMSRGRSAANFEAVLHQVDGDLFPEGFLEGCHVNIFMTDMLEIIQNTNISKGVTDTHLWTFCKRGSNYGIQLVNG